MATLVDLDESLARAKGLKLEEMDAEEIQNEIDLLDEVNSSDSAVTNEIS